MIFLSPRQWLAQGPRALQLFAVVLSLLGALAPTWHVCAMGGHVMAAPHGAAHDAGARYVTVLNADGTPGPVVCAAVPPPPPKVHGNAFAPRPAAHGDVSCLAMLLQTMPLHAATAPTLHRPSTTRPIYFARPREGAAFEAPRQARGRAPPANC